MGEVVILNCIGNPIEWQQRIHWTFPSPRGDKGGSKNRRLNQYHRRRQQRVNPQAEKSRAPPWVDFPIIPINTNSYAPSVPAWKFHTSAARFRALVAGVKSGKCLTVDQGVMMADGSIKPAGDLRPGDEILGLENRISRPIQVIAVEPAQKDCVEMTFVDGSVIRCSKDHRFPFWYYRGNCVVVRPVGEILKPGKGLDTKYKFIKPRAIHFTGRKRLALDAYFLGLLLGDACLTRRGVTFSTASDELLQDVTTHSEAFGLSVVHQAGTYDYRLTAGRKSRDARGYGYNPLIAALDGLGLMGCNSHTKFIPQEYLLASLTDRLKLLAGLIDTDGYVYNQNRMIEYCTMSDRMAAQLQFLVRSVGGYCSNLKGHVGQNRLGITLNRELPTKVPYKKLAPIKRDKTRIGLSSWRDIGQQDCVHISVDADNELFLLDNAVATHNTVVGAVETVRAALGLAGELHWVVAPVSRNLREPETEILRILNELQPYGIRFERKLAKKQIRLNNGSVIEFVAGDIPNNLRGPTINGSMWIDEVAFLREESFYVLRTRIITGQAEMWFTTSPNWRNWFWALCRQMGLPATQPYGEFETQSEGQPVSFLSHHPTWNFPWVPKSEIAGMRKTWPRKKFDAEIGGMFGSPDAQVFPGVRDCLSLEPPPKELSGVNVLGLDLAQAQDFTAVTVMDPMGRVHHVDRWTGKPWKETISRALKLAKDWACIIAYDKSHVGSVIGELIDDSGAKTMALDCHNAQLKASMIQGLAIAFEQQQVSIPDPTADWADDEAQSLLDELEQYEQGLTRGGSLTYSAPKGLHDDMVMSLAMANWCRVRGGMGGAAAAIATVPRRKWDRVAGKKDIERMAADHKAGKQVKRRKSRAGAPLDRHYSGKMGWNRGSGLWR